MRIEERPDGVYFDGKKIDEPTALEFLVDGVWHLIEIRPRCVEIATQATGPACARWWTADAINHPGPPPFPRIMWAKDYDCRWPVDEPFDFGPL
ncbi:MAG: hypothetical protein E6R03_09410 [Hyphomicrobiaceae bacterium]|nr:MAG: hypothetical protein E6R03_09410 [Hyphomicrobiaceae bacterium]